ncbi:subtilisin-like serine protease [Rhizopus stolonifer]|uniref:Subtilisin-like serine protease n=1 Tax=Rhizopus stolonifer TaxID=4846 RepID=A0A367JQI8_RHIST|nr:subtilisin-like serine protease [Rhizopus stolonifer]
MNITGFEPTSFIKKHYTTFQATKTTLQGKNALMDTGVTDDIHQDDLSTESIRNIEIGQEFKAVAGFFNPSFVSYLNQLEDIEYVEPNQIYKAAIQPIVSSPQPYSASNVPLQRSKKHRYKQRTSKQKRGIMTQENVPSWGIARINRRELSDLTTYSADDAAGAGVHVYIFDSGINADHPDFGGRANMEASFIDYEDDTDHAGHGTHVAGTIGGNSFGVAKNTILHGIKILDRNGDGATSALIQAISYVAQIAPPGNSIINLSLTGPRSQTIDDALSTVVQEYGIPVFVSAGNSGDDSCKYSPSANADVFAVGASDENDMIPSFSSYGDCVNVYAPGTNITSSWLGGESQTMDGTSMANPHVTGIAAMLLGEYQFNSVHELYDKIKSMATQNVLRFEANEGDDYERLLAYNGLE